MKNLSIRSVAAMCVAMLLLVGACSDESSPAGATSSDDSAAEETSPSPSEDAPTESPAPTDESDQDDSEGQEESDAEESASVTFEVWFGKGDRLAPALVQKPSTPRVGSAALEALLAGPPSGDAKLTSAIPLDTTVNGLTIEGGTATVDLSKSYESGGGTFSMGLRLGQVTFTLTQFPTVKRVAFELDGKPVEVFSGEGLVIEKPLTRADFEDFSPPIVTSRPLSGAEVTSPVKVSGTANVFEANVSIRIVDAAGNVLAETFSTATCGSGCRGDFSKKVNFEVEEPTEATIIVYEQSAKDGRDRFPVEIPVTLSP